MPKKTKALVPAVVSAEVIPADSKILGMPIVQDPDKMIAEAKRVAVAIKRVIDRKPKKVIINGKRYVEFDDWQMIGSPYGVTAKVKETSEIWDRTDKKKKKFIGFLAKAAAVKDGVEISQAEAECLVYEKNWRFKAYNQRFMIRSMAQTRASAKALSNVLRWVIVLAGYEGTPAEEMIAKKGKKTIPNSLYRTILRAIKRRGIKMKKVKDYVDDEFGFPKIKYLNKAQGELLLAKINKKGGI